MRRSARKTLQFFKNVLGDRRIVQLGESGHGVAEFNHAKVRLIKFLHQQMGFDVIAFESGLYECYAANNAVVRAPDMSATALMRSCIFGVWHTEEVLPLFEYITSTQGTARPLTLAGFDTQMSSAIGVSTRPAFFAEPVRAIEPGRAADVQTTDQLRMGTGATNSRQVYTINPAPENSLEWIMTSAGAPVLFMDFLKQERSAGNSWMFESTLQREWGMNPAFGMVPWNQYDGVLFVETVKSPAYITQF